MSMLFTSIGLIINTQLTKGVWANLAGPQSQYPNLQFQTDEFKTEPYKKTDHNSCCYHDHAKIPSTRFVLDSKPL